MEINENIHVKIIAIEAKSLKRLRGKTKRICGRQKIIGGSVQVPKRDRRT